MPQAWIENSLIYYKKYFNNTIVDYNRVSLTNKRFLLKCLCFNWLLFNYINAANEENNGEILSSQKNQSDVNNYTPSMEEQKKVKYILSDVLNESQYNLLIIRIRTCINNLRDYLLDKKYFVAIYIINMSFVDSSGFGPFLNSSEELILIPYLKNFLNSKEFDVFIKSGNLSYFDSLVNEINKLQNTGVLKYYIEKLDDFRAFLCESDEISEILLDTYNKMCEYMENCQNCFDKLHINLDIFLTKICEFRTQNMDESQSSWFNENYKKACDLFIDKFIEQQFNILFEKSSCTDMVSKLLYILPSETPNSDFIQFSNTLKVYRILQLDHKIIVTPKSIDLILESIQNEVTENFALLKEDACARKCLDKINIWYEILLHSLSEQIEKKILSLRKTYLDMGVLNVSDNTCVDNNSNEFLKYKYDIIEKYIDIILDDLNPFFILMIYTNTFSDNFIGYLKDLLGTCIYSDIDKFANFIATYKKSKSFLKQNAEHKNIVDEKNVKSNNKNDNLVEEEASNHLAAFFELKFGSNIYNRIYMLDEMFNNFSKKLLEIEKNIIEWYIVLISEGGFKKDNKIDYFIKAYIQKQKIITKKYVNFFKLDKEKYIIKKDLTVFNSFNVTMCNFL